MPLPLELALSVLLQLRDLRRRELLLGGHSVHRVVHGARTTSVVDLGEGPTCNLQGPFDGLHFDVSRAALDDIAVACGFVDQSHFTCAFAATVGSSPGIRRCQLR